MSARIGVRLGLDCRRGLSKTLPSITASPIRRPSIHHGLTLSPFQIPTLPSRSLYFSSVICAAQHQTQVQSEHKADRTEAGTLAPKGITEEVSYRGLVTKALSTKYRGASCSINQRSFPRIS